MNRRMHRYETTTGEGGNWCDVRGRGWVVTVDAPFTRHHTGDVVLIHTATPGFRPREDYWFVRGVEGTRTGRTSSLCVRPATEEEITAATSESVPGDDEEPGVAEARVLIARALRLLGEPDSHRAVVETLCVARDALGHGRDAA